jgi:acetoacetate decarboxylase
MSNYQPVGLFGAVKKAIAEINGKKQNLWDGARFILADVPLHPDKVKTALPWFLKPANPPMATLFVVNYPKTSFTVPYHEAAMLIHVKHLLGNGLHCHTMTVDDDTALIYGRELLGYPKKFAQFEFIEDGDRVRGSYTRRGVKVLEMEGTKGARQPDPKPVFDVKTFNVGGPGSWFILNPIWLLRPREIIHESYAMDVKINLEPSQWDPIKDLIIGEPVNGRFVILDIVNSRYNLIAGFSGPSFLMTNFNIRFR